MSGRLNIVKMPVLPKLICKLNAISIKFPSAFFVEVDHLVLKFTWNTKDIRRAKTTVKKNKFGGLTLIS